MLKSLILVLAISTLAAAGTVVGFSGAYDPSNWAFTNDAFGNSHVDWTGAPGSLTVYRNNAFTDPLLPSLTELTITAPSAATISFDYSFGAGDLNWSDKHDQFGAIENGAKVPLFDTYQNASSTNPFFISTSFAVTAGETIGFYISTEKNDGEGGQSFTIRNLEATSAPEPASLAFLAAGIGMLLMRRRSLSRSH